MSSSASPGNAAPSTTSRRLPILSGEWRRFGVAHAWLFGSRSRGEARPNSDWDFLVEFAAPATFDTFMGLKLSLEDKLGAPVDLLSQTACKPRFISAIRKDLIDVT